MDTYYPGMDKKEVKKSIEFSIRYFLDYVPSVFEPEETDVTYLARLNQLEKLISRAVIALADGRK